MPQRIGQQVLQGPMQVARLGLDPTAQLLRHQRALLATDQHLAAQRGDLLHHLAHQHAQLQALVGQRRRALFQARVGEHLVDQLVEVLDIVVHALQVLQAGAVGLGGLDHLQAEAQPRHRRAQLVGHRANHLALHRQQPVDVLGHMVEGRAQASHRVASAHLDASIQAAAGDPRGGRLQAAQALLQATHQQVGDQADEAQAQRAEQQQQLRRIGVHLEQRAQLQHPGRVEDAGEDADRVAVLAQRHHRVALHHSPALVVVEVQFLDLEQVHREAEALVADDPRQVVRLFAGRVAHQFVHQQVHRGPRQLLADLLHLAAEHQVLGGAGLGIDGDGVLGGLLHQHLAVHQARAAASVHPQLIQPVQLQGNTQQAAPLRQGALALGGGHRLQVVGHQAEGAARQLLAVVLAAHLVDPVQAEQAQAADQQQGQEHAAIDAQEDGFHRRAPGRCPLLLILADRDARAPARRKKAPQPSPTNR